MQMSQRRSSFLSTQSSFSSLGFLLETRGGAAFFKHNLGTFVGGKAA
jgi:hypothetical protein